MSLWDLETAELELLANVFVQRCTGQCLALSDMFDPWGVTQTLHKWPEPGPGPAQAPQGHGNRNSANVAPATLTCFGQLNENNGQNGVDITSSLQECNNKTIKLRVRSNLLPINIGLVESLKNVCQGGCWQQSSGGRSSGIWSAWFPS